MPPLTRSESIHSWWSDSNHPGPTLNLHALAKPLMRLMYHRQALQFMKKNRDIPLTSTTIEIYLSYLEYKYVGASTKVKMLEYIAKKPIREDDAHAVAHSILAQSNVLDLFLQASDAQMQIHACDVLVNLVLNTSSAPVVLHLNPCVRTHSLGVRRWGSRYPSRGTEPSP
ncbi:hypothetical protein B0H14DRAFT_1707037 [Mycena olivaceomarginata]|nr:hypothetical protein B0H14DRAFT_1707037 [Mycena olivaceomarginata]